MFLTVRNDICLLLNSIISNFLGKPVRNKKKPVIIQFPVLYVCNDDRTFRGRTANEKA